MKFKSFLLAMFACFYTIIAAAIPFSSISEVYFFGDSLTDSGFNNHINGLSDPTKAPTFTTYGGYTWAQYIARDVRGYTLPTSYPAPPFSDTITNNQTPINPAYPAPPGVIVPILSGIDFAAGGSTTNGPGFNLTWAPSLVQQIQFFISIHPVLDPNAVYFIWSGSNDILSALLIPGVTELYLLQTANAATTVIADQVALLYSYGARRFVIMSLPNMAYAPEFVALNDPATSESVKNINFTFNSMLNQKLGAVIKRTGAKVLYIDAYTLLGNLIQTANAGQPYIVAGHSFQFINTTNEACAPAPSSLVCPSSAPSNYVFADAIHPTDLTHQALALAVEQKILSWT